VVSCPSLPGCYTQGDTIDETLENIREAIFCVWRTCRPRISLSLICSEPWLAVWQ